MALFGWIWEPNNKIGKAFSWLLFCMVQSGILNRLREVHTWGPRAWYRPAKTAESDVAFNWNRRLRIVLERIEALQKSLIVTERRNG